MERYKQVKSASESDFPTTLLLEAGAVPVIKSRPKRTLIVAAAVAVAFVFSVIGVVVFDTYRDVNWREIMHVR
jgi:LPS O-antigen subunit length determinant protein (WzzB/FepE family)